MISFARKLPALKYLSQKRSSPLFLFLICTILYNPFQSVNAQEIDNNQKWSIGFQAGVLSGNLPSVSATNALISRFNVEDDFYLTAAIQAGLSITEFESLYLTVSRGEFSVFTDHEFWPDLLFKNQFYTANLTTQLDLRRFIGSLPNRLDPYGSFGLGIMSSRNTIAPFNSQDTVQNDYSDDISNELSFLFTTGVGLDVSLSSSVSIFFQFNHNFLSSDIIDKNLAGEVLQNDFIQITDNWSTYTSGIRFRFGRAKLRTQSVPESNDFPIVSTINVDRLTELEEQLADPDDRIHEEVPVSEPVDSILVEEHVPEQVDSILVEEQVPELIDDVEDDMTELDSTTVEQQMAPVLPDSTVETQIEEEITQNEVLIPEEEPDTELNDIASDNEDDIVFTTQPQYGLMGVAVERITGSFTINLHSYSNHNDANNTILRLDSEGYRVVTQVVNVNGVDYLRVGVGQFETRRDAQSAVESLPEPYRSNYFIIQI